MKKTLITAAIALSAFAGAASAMTSADTYVERQIHAYAPDADVSALTNGEVVHILKEIRSGGDKTEAEIAAGVRSLVKAFQ